MHSTLEAVILLLLTCSSYFETVGSKQTWITQPQYMEVTASSFMAKDTLMSSPAKLIVRDPPKSVQLRSGTSKESILGAISAPEGEEQRIQCLGVGGSPPPQLKWYLGDRELLTAHRTINPAGNVVSTIALQMSRTDHGKALRCSAEHPALTTIVDVKSFLDVQYAPIVDITSGESLTDLTEGSSVRLHCTADANPAASIQWFKESASGEVLSHSGDLTLSHLTVETAGKYYCQANNSLGASQPKYVDVKVKYAPIIDDVGPSPNIRQLWGTKLVLTCQARGNPAPQYTWIQYTHSGVELRGEGRDLVLDRLVYSDEGRYECRARNSISGHMFETKSKTIEVDVYGSPKVNQPVSEVYVHRGSRGVVEVEFCADPLPKQIWHIDSNPGQKILIHAGTSHEGYSVLTASKLSKPNCYTSTLEIDNVTDKHRSEYIVHFENEHGREIHTVRVKIGAFLGKETLIGGLIGGGMTLVIVLLLLVCCCTKYARTSKGRKHDQESPAVQVEKWSTGSSVSSSSEISTETQQTNQSAGNNSTSADTRLMTNQNAATSRPGSARAGSTSSSGTGVSIHNISQASMMSNGTRHSVMSMSTQQTLVSPPPVSPPLSSVFQKFSPDIIQNHCERKNVSFSDDLSVSQECLKNVEAAISALDAAAKQPPTTAAQNSQNVAVNYNDLCFPKTSNYGSMRKQGRCDFLTRSNIKRIDDVIREHEQEQGIIRSQASSRASVRSNMYGVRPPMPDSRRSSVRGVTGERRNYINSEYNFA